MFEKEILKLKGQINTLDKELNNAYTSRKINAERFNKISTYIKELRTETDKYQKLNTSEQYTNTTRRMGATMGAISHAIRDGQKNQNILQYSAGEKIKNRLIDCMETNELILQELHKNN